MITKKEFLETLDNNYLERYIDGKILSAYKCPFSKMVLTEIDIEVVENYKEFIDIMDKYAAEWDKVYAFLRMENGLYIDLFFFADDIDKFNSYTDELTNSKKNLDILYPPVENSEEKFYEFKEYDKKLNEACKVFNSYQSRYATGERTEKDVEEDAYAAFDEIMSILDPEDKADTVVEATSGNKPIDFSKPFTFGFDLNS